jgi:hypothetical protein
LLKRLDRSDSRARRSRLIATLRRREAKTLDWVYHREHNFANRRAGIGAPFVGDTSLYLSEATDGASGTETYLLHPTLTREVADMKLSKWLTVPSAFVLASLMMCVSGCVVHDREVVHDGGYAQGYKEGYYDHEHNRWWHNQGWQDCVDNDTHCH